MAGLEVCGPQYVDDSDQPASFLCSINIKVQQLAKEQQRCHKEVICNPGLPAGRRAVGRGEDGGELLGSARPVCLPAPAGLL